MTDTRICCLVAFLCLTASSVLAQVPADLQKTMDERDHAVSNIDVATWDRLTADDFTLVDNTGAFMTKAQRIAQLKTEKPTPYTAPQRVQIKRYGDAYIRRFLSDGSLWVLDVWIRQGNTWRVAAVQTTDAKK
jgi:uncharacterized protein DUF4440